MANTVALNRFENEITGDRVTEASSAESVLAYFKRRTANGGLMLVAEAEGRVIGHLFLAVEEAAPFLAPEYRRECSICDAFVEDASRGQGAFRAMLEIATAHARAAGCFILVCSPVMIALNASIARPASGAMRWSWCRNLTRRDDTGRRT